jgi:soluble lytic murein transglycosylase
MKEKRNLNRLFIMTIIILIVLAFICIKEKDTFYKVLYPVTYKELVFKYSDKNDIDPYLTFAIIKTESGFDSKAKSHRGAKGLMQIMDSTGAWAARYIGIEEFEPDDLFDPETNINIGCWYFRSLMNEYKSNMDLAIAAYNGGSGNVNQWLKDENISNTGISLDKIPFKETRQFLSRVKENYETYKKIYRK